MNRISKPPEVRKQEIIDTAMLLFAQKGYDSTSMSDVAKELQVVPGLCYRYFSSKQELFNTAVTQYAKESCMEFIEILINRKLPIQEKFDRLFAALIEKENHVKYGDFYHKQENTTFHVQLAIEMCNILYPYILNNLESIKTDNSFNPKVLADFILFGQVSLWAKPGEQDDVCFEERVEQMKVYILRLINI